MASVAVASGEGFPVVMPGASLTSCRPLLSLLQEDDAKLKYCALQKMVRSPAQRQNGLACLAVVLIPLFCLRGTAAVGACPAKSCLRA